MSDINQWDGSNYTLAGIGEWGRGMDPQKDRGRALHESARRCRETPGDVMPEPGARYRSPWSRELMDRNAKRARAGGR